MEKRLIDANALETDLVRRWNVNDDTDFAKKEVWRALSEAPTVDAVPVIRCKDCRYWTEWGSRTGSCQRSDSVMWLGTDAIDFCSFAERKDDEID